MLEQHLQNASQLADDKKRHETKLTFVQKEKTNAEMASSDLENCIIKIKKLTNETSGESRAASSCQEIIFLILMIHEHEVLSNYSAVSQFARNITNSQASCNTTEKHDLHSKLSLVSASQSSIQEKIFQYKRQINELKGLINNIIDQMIELNIQLSIHLQSTIAHGTHHMTEQQHSYSSTTSKDPFENISTYHSYSISTFSSSTFDTPTTMRTLSSNIYTEETVSNKSYSTTKTFISRSSNSISYNFASSSTTLKTTTLTTLDLPSSAISPSAELSSTTLKMKTTLSLIHI